MANNLVALPRIDSEYLNANDLDRTPELYPEIVDVANEGGIINALRNLKGRSAPSKTPDFYHYENGESYRSVAVASVVTGASTTEVVITLTDDSYSAVGSLIGSKFRAPLKAKDLVVIPVAGAAAIHAIVIGKSDPTPVAGSAMNGVFGYGTPTNKDTTYTLRLRVGDTANLRTALTAMVGNVAKRMTAYSNAHAEGSYQPIETMDGLSTRYMGTMQIWKTSKTITREALAQAYSIPYLGGNKLVSKNRIENVQKHQSDIGWAMLMSPGGQFLSEDGEPINLTKSFTSYITEGGVRIPYTEADGFDLDNLTAVTNAIKSVRGDKTYFVVAGNEIRPQIEAILRTLNTNTGIDYSVFGDGDGKTRMVDLGFDGFKWNGITFYLIEEPLFNYSPITGLAGMNYSKRAFLIPAGNQKVSYMQGLDQIFQTAPAIRTLYLAHDGISMRYEDWVTDHKTNGGRMVTTHNLYSMEGLQLMGVSKFLEIYPA